MAEMGLSQAEHAAWAQRNLEAYHGELERFRASINRQRCDVAALLEMYRHAYGTEINAKDAGNEQLAAWAAEARKSILGFLTRACRGRVSHKMCGQWWGRAEPKLRAP